MKAVIQRANNYFIVDTELKREMPITEEEFRYEYFHKTKYPYVNDKNELVYVIKEMINES